MKTIEILNEITKAENEQWMPTGSKVICNPAPTDTDTDYVAVVDGVENLSYAVAILIRHGFKADMDDHYQDLMEYSFISWKRNSDNIILTKNREFYDKHCVATQVCQKLNLLNKQDRIMVFQAVLYGNWQEAQA
jgi:hypothetical protein